jgi:GT2 family glycosyltransferase
MGNPLYTISIAVHNRLDLTQKCVESIRASGHAGEYALIVTDNASTDGTRAWLEAQPDVAVFANERNLGFGVPHNRALSHTGTPLFVVLNNDVTVCAGWLGAMGERFRRNPLLALCGIRGTCSEIGPDGIGHPGPGLDYIEASCLMARTEIVRKHGLFSDEFRFAYAEDADLSLRMRSLGFEIDAVDIPVRHMGCGTSSILKDVDLEGYKIRNRHLLLAKWPEFFGKKKRGDIRSKVLIRRTGAQGDVILLTPALAAFRGRYPKVHVTVSTACPVVLSGNPDVDAVIECSPDPKGYDRFFDLDMVYEKEPLTHPVMAYARALELMPLDGSIGGLRIYPDPPAKAIAAEVMPKNGSQRYAVIHPGSIPGWVGREWRGSWPGVLAEIRKMGFKTIRVGNHQTPPIPCDLDFTNWPFMRLAAIMGRADLFVGVDSMPFHVAQAVEIPAVGIFGCVEPSLRIVSPRAVGVTAENVGCLGCHHWLPAPRTVTNYCLRGRELCMERLTPERIVEGVRRALGVS